MTLTYLASLRFLLQHRLQCVLAVTGIALGVAIVIGIQTLQAGARQAFAAALVGVFGSASHVIQTPSGNFDERVLARVRRALPEFDPSPIVVGTIRVARSNGEHTLTLIGVDPLSGRGDTGSAGIPLVRFMSEPGAAVLSHRTAQQLDVKLEDSLMIAKPNRSAAALRVIAVLDEASAPALLGSAGVLVDIATAQELLGQPDMLTRIALHAPPGDSEAALNVFAETLPAPLALNSHGHNLQSSRRLTRAFYTNLDALSLLALLVGGFMVYNTVAFLVVQRQVLFARLRALGVARAELMRLIAFEAGVLAIAGGSIGSLLGFWFAGRLAQPWRQNLADHYLGLDALAATPSLMLFGAGCGLALVTALLAAAQPAWKAANSAVVWAESRSARERDTARTHRTGFTIGVALAVLGVALLVGSSRSIHLGFAALACLLLAVIALVPKVVEALLRAVEVAVGRYLPLAENLALKAGQRSLGRLGIAVATLMAATAISIGVGLMVASFRDAVDTWLQQMLRADLYLAHVEQSENPGDLDAALAETVREIPGVNAVSRVRRLPLTAEVTGARVSAFELPPAARAGFRFIAGGSDQAWRDWHDGRAVFVSEPYAHHNRLRVGESLTLVTPGGALPRPIAGIYADYANEHGTIAITWSLYTAHWRDTRADGIGVYLTEPAAHDAVRAELAALATRIPTLGVWSNAELRTRSLMIFDRTFVITNALTVLAELIAALGVFNALLALHLERAREYGMMRALGCGRALIRRCLYAQTAFVAASASLLAMPVGAGIAWLLIEVINLRSFGWSMPFVWHSGALLSPAALAIAAALLAGIYPAEHALRGEPARTLRNE